MLVLLYLVTVNYALPQMLAITYSLFQIIMPCVVLLIGITILLSVIGLRVSNNLGSIILEAIFRFLGYIGSNIFRGLGWFIRYILNLLPRVFVGSRRMFINSGLSEIASSLLAFITALLIALIII